MIGLRVVRLLREAGRPVIATDRTAPSQAPGETIVAAELTDPLRMLALAREAGSIIHCGAASGPMVGRDHPAGVANVNIGGTVTLLEAARLFGMSRFVHCSSVVAYGNTDPRLGEEADESTPLAATDVYGASKAASDLMVQAYARQHGVDARIARIGWVYGPGRQAPGVVSTLLRNALDGRPTVFDHDGSYAVPLVHADDVASALVSLHDLTTPAQRAFNVTGEDRTPIRDLAGMIRTMLPAAEITFTPGVVLDDYVQGRLSTKALRATGWKPLVSLEDGLSAYRDWLSAHPF